VSRKSKARETLVYVAAILPEEVGGYSITVPDVPAAISQADTMEEALANAREVIELVLENTDPEDWPEPSEPKEVARKVTKSGAIPAPVLVKPEPQGKAVPVNVTLDEKLLAKIDRAAKALGQTRSGFLAESAKAFIRAHGAA
jgi:predicted RNase H-like HicB family nuclease